VRGQRTDGEAVRGLHARRRVEPSGAKPEPAAPDPRHEGAVLGPDLGFEVAANLARERRALAACRHRDLQIAAAKNRWKDEVARARTIMQSHIDDPLPCEAVAQQVGLSLRQLERRFKQQLGQTLHSEYMLVRVEKAHQYLQQTALSVTEVSALTGFTSVEYFSKVYRRVFGVLPSKDRRQSTDAPVFRRKVAKRKSG